MMRPLKTSLFSLCLFLQADAQAVLSPQQVREEADLADTGASREALIAKVFASKRVDLIQALFPFLGESGLFKDQLRKLPPSDQKNQIILMILQEPWASDPPPEGRGTLGPSRILGSLGEICIDVMSPYFPGEPSDRDDAATVARFSNHSDRMLLAEQFKEALDQSNSSSGPRPERRPAVGEVPSESKANSPATSKKADPVSTVEKKPVGSFKWVPLLFAVAYGLGFFAWRIARMKSAGSRPF